MIFSFTDLCNCLSNPCKLLSIQTIHSSKEFHCSVTQWKRNLFLLYTLNLSPTNFMRISIKDHFKKIAQLCASLIQNCSINSSQSLLGNFDKVVVGHIEPEHSGQREHQFLIISTLDPPWEKDSLHIQRNSRKYTSDSYQMHQTCKDLHHEIKLYGFAPAQIHVIFLSFHKMQSETSYKQVLLWCLKWENVGGGETRGRETRLLYTKN